MKRNYPVQPSLTWDIQDSTKTQTFMRCPRKYFFEYILGWRPEKISIHLIFGESWHRGLEKIIQLGYSNESIDAAMSAFEGYYREFFPPHLDVDNIPKSPGDAFSAYKSYIAKYKNKDEHYKALFTEISGSVPVGTRPDGSPREMHFRLDSIWKDIIRNEYFSMEHKTSSRNSAPWQQQWRTKTQISLYTHVLYCLYETKEVYGTIVNGSFFYKSKPHDHVRIPVRKSPQVMQAWMQTINWWLSSIEREFELLKLDSSGEAMMKSFPMNTEACTDYGICPYFDFCTSWENPLKHAENTPGGFKIDHWNPADREKEASTLLRDGKLIKQA